MMTRCLKCDKSLIYIYVDSKSAFVEIWLMAMGMWKCCLVDFHVFLDLFIPVIWNIQIDRLRERSTTMCFSDLFIIHCSLNYSNWPIDWTWYIWLKVLCDLWILLLTMMLMSTKQWFEPKICQNSHSGGEKPKSGYFHRCVI